MVEYPWWPNPPDAKIVNVGTDPTVAILCFPSPEPGNEECKIAVTTGSSDGPARGVGSARDLQYHYYGWVWHIDGHLRVGDLATVSPSVHFHNHFHSPSPVQFRITEIVN